MKVLDFLSVSYALSACAWVTVVEERLEYAFTVR
jgi:hypothetical protein